jgi:hypothetical protein
MRDTVNPAPSYSVVTGFRHDSCIVATLGGDDAQKTIRWSVDACVSRLARPKVKSNKRHQERNDMNWRVGTRTAPEFPGAMWGLFGSQRAILLLMD